MACGYHMLYQCNLCCSEFLLSTVHVQGSLVRAFRRIEEVLRQLISGAKVIGDSELAGKFEEASESIKRGVVFAASLYL